MKMYENPVMNINEFSRSIVTELSGTNKADAVADVKNKANGGFTAVSFGDLEFTL